MKNIFVGNLPFGTTEGALRELFSPFGEVAEVRIMTDRDTGKSRGFAFVEMSEDDAAKAIAALNGKDYEGRALTINEARPKPERSGGFRPGGGGGGGGGFGGKRRKGSGSGEFRGPRSPREPRW